MHTTTLIKLRNADACSRGYNAIARKVGDDDFKEIPLELILDNNGLEDAIWSLRATDEGRVLAVTFAILCAKPFSFQDSWHSWADQWLSGECRLKELALIAYERARVAEEMEAALAAKAGWFGYSTLAADIAGRTSKSARHLVYIHDGAAALAEESIRQVAIFRKLVRGESHV